MKHIISLLFFFSVSLHSQTIEEFPLLPKELKSPTSADLGHYGEIPMSYYTGQSCLKVPVFSTQVRDIPLDISLSYNSSGVQINNLPGWTGHNWTLTAGGVITRTVVGDHDEKTLNLNSCSYKNYFQSYDYLSNLCTFDNTTGRFINSGDLKNELLSYKGAGRDMSPDIFTFNFMGMTGRFFMGGDGQWKIDSDCNIDVEFDVGNASNFARPFVDKYPDKTSQPTMIRGFRLRDDKGTVYEFGDIANTSLHTDGDNTTEYSMNLFATSTADHLEPWIANAWYLKRVADKYGNTLYSFSYERGYFVTQFHNYWERTVFNNSSAFFGINVGSGGDTNNYSFPYMALLCSPVYLSKISCANGVEIKFNRRDIGKSMYYFYDERKIDNTSLISQMSRHVSGNMHNNLQFLGGMYDNLKPFYYLQSKNAGVTRYQWNQGNNSSESPLKSAMLCLLDNIVVSVKDNADKFKTTYRFQYEKSPKLHLVGLTQENANSAATMSYRMTYNSFARLPQDYLSRAEDHWGYYMGHEYDILNFQKDFSRQRDPDTATVTYGTLRSIVYPTGGMTVFEYEPNDYSKYVVESRNALAVENGIGGGVRIKSVTNYEDSLCSKILSHTEYEYKNADGTSSGVLYAKPKYYWLDWYGNPLDEKSVVKVSVSRSTSIVPLFNSHNPSVGYSTVTERHSDGSYTEYSYSNDWTGANADERFCFGINSGAPSPFDMYSEKLYARGELTGKKIFDSDGKMVQQDTYSYERSEDVQQKFVLSSNIKSVNYGNSAGTMLCIGGIYKLYYQKSRPALTVSRIRTEGGFFTENTKYINRKFHLDMSNGYKHTTDVFLLRTMLKSGGSVEPQAEKGYEYPFESNDSVEKSVSLLMFDLTPSKTRIFSDGRFVKTLYTKYARFRVGNGSLCAPSQYIALYNAGKADTLVSYLGYNGTGRLIQYKAKGAAATSLIWGWQDNYLLAKCENLPYNAISEMSFSENNFLDVRFMTDAMNRLRIKNPLAHITSYTYNPLYGITSVTSPAGYSEYYDYEGLRLVNIYDNDHKTVEHYEYNFRK